MDPLITALLAHLEVIGWNASLQEAGACLATIPGYTDMLRIMSLPAEVFRDIAALVDDIRLVGGGAETRVERRRR